MCWERGKRVNETKVKMIFLVILWSLSAYLCMQFIVTRKTALWYPIDGTGSWIRHLCPHYQLRERSEYTLSWRPPSVRTIFFTQTSCDVTLSIREACAVESAARHHPRRPVVVYMTSPDLDRNHPLFKLLMTLENVEVVWLDLDQVFSEGVLKAWHEDRVWMLSEGRTSAEVSDAARAELLRRFGGTYVDLDAITLRPLPNATNWLGRVDAKLVNAAVSSFAPRHPLLQEVVDAIPESFNPQECCTIGPNLFTSVLHRLCPDNVTIPPARESSGSEFCKGVTIFPRSHFYPIHYGYEKNQLQSMFREGEGLGKAFLRRKEPFSLHLFHSLSQHGRVSPDADSVLKEVAEKNCPDVFQLVRIRKLWL